ncbi:toll/interleukin-1 receptor domain-containing protein [Fodinibius salsisoli]|uniref:Toll/interleukin-1 receptor domain-containing protein n=1 Tax=Fodinibius salsisoli TaxID=2820877 RepID=A0ABT3PNI8_9BACT|nr:toll/interleukin-1 receptor domain-containing protein [Fodinibius salsisoli]MCW9707426.1 toll/interleukin-1 receptor domain-containing protein [Fodinibius salsisoli]
MSDIFISHASEDKGKLVRHLANKLEEENLSVWYDEHTLKPGDSLRKSIDDGLQKSKYGLIVLSPSFFGKHWPEWELNGLVQLQNSSEKNRIIPVWHNVDHKDVMQYSPALADIVAIKSDLGIDYIVKRILNVVKPEVSSLVHARSLLQDLGYSPPPPKDEWWLDVIEYDGSDSNIFDWAFHVGFLPKDPLKRGELLAKKAIQRKWQEIVIEENISQATNPESLIRVIDSIPGAFNLLKESINYTICYAPQLTIKGFEGPFKSQINELYEKDLERQSKQANSESGIALTTHGESPSCSLKFSLRHPNFGFYKPSFVTCQFVQGELMGPTPKIFDHFDYLVWLLSNDSNWLPSSIKQYLIDGFLDWNVWMWNGPPSRSPDYIKKSNVTGSLRKQIYTTAKEDSEFQLSDNSLKDIHERIGWSLELLEIDSAIEEISNQFIDGGFIESCIDEYRDRVTNK